MAGAAAAKRRNAPSSARSLERSSSEVLQGFPRGSTKTTQKVSLSQNLDRLGTRY